MECDGHSHISDYLIYVLGHLHRFCAIVPYSVFNRSREIILAAIREHAYLRSTTTTTKPGQALLIPDMRSSIRGNSFVHFLLNARRRFEAADCLEFVLRSAIIPRRGSDLLSRCCSPNKERIKIKTSFRDDRIYCYFHKWEIIRRMEPEAMPACPRYCVVFIDGITNLITCIVVISLKDSRTPESMPWNVCSLLILYSRFCIRTNGVNSVPGSL